VAQYPPIKIKQLTSTQL